MYRFLIFASLLTWKLNGMIFNYLYHTEEQTDKDLNGFFAKQHARFSKKIPWEMQLNESLKAYLTKVII